MEPQGGFLAKAILAISIAGFIIVLNDVVLRIYLKEKKRPQFVFLRRLIRFAALVILALFLIAEYWGMTRLANLLAGSVAIVSGIVAFACQSIFRDFFEGLVISISRPFDIGDRLMLDSVGKPCVVEEITAHHVVLKTMDGIRYIVPNSKISSEVITNTSYRQRLRGTFISVSVSYNTDLPKAMALVLEAVKECPHTFPNVEANTDLGGYGDVYFTGFQDSSLLLETVIWTEPETDNFLAGSEVRSAILKKFRENGVEIPYGYLNVIEKEEEKAAPAEESSGIRKRNVRIKTDAVEVRLGAWDVQKVRDKTKEYAKYHGIPEEQTQELMLMSEELMLFAENVMGVRAGRFWVEGKKERTLMHFRTKINLDQEKKEDVLQLSTSGKNEAQRGFVDLVRDSILKWDSNEGKKMVSYSGYIKDLDHPDEDLELKLLTGLADDIKVAIWRGTAEITCVKRILNKSAGKGASSKK